MQINAYLTRLIWLCVAPPLLSAAWLAFESVRSAETERDIAAANFAQNLATAIDHDLQALIGALSVLAASPPVGEPRTIGELSLRLHRNRSSITKDVGLLERLGLIVSQHQANPGRGIQKLARSVAPQIEMVGTLGQ